MFCKLQNYQLDVIPSCKDELCALLKSCSALNEEDITFLLDTKNIQHIVQKTVYDIAKFHLDRLQRPFDDSIFIEFWFKSNEDPSKVLHVDSDEYDRQINHTPEFGAPLLSCITYLNDNNEVPTVITEVDGHAYKYKEFNQQDGGMKICFSFPKEWKHICFDGGKYYHGARNISTKNRSDRSSLLSRNLLLVNIWDKKPLNVPYFDITYFYFKYAMRYKTEWKTIYFEPKDPLLQFRDTAENICCISAPETVLTKEFFENLLYKPNTEDDIFGDIRPLLATTNKDLIVLESQRCPSSKSNSINRTMVDITKTKFKQRFVFQNHFTKDICKWIIHECEEYASNNNGWMTDRHQKYPTTDLPAQNVEHVFRFILTTFAETISKHILEAYQLKENEKDNIEFQLKDVFIVKYEHDKQNHLEMHIDWSMITVSILLSDPATDFVGGGTCFEDNLTLQLKRGDLLIHCSKDKHSGIPITSGKRYLLVYFIDAYNVNGI